MADERDEMVRLTKLFNSVEAQAVGDLLEAEGIPHNIRPFEVSQYPSVRTGGGPWGEVRVPSGELARAEQALAQHRESAVEEDELARQAEDAPPPESERSRGRSPGALMLWVALWAAVLLGVWLLRDHL